MILNIIVPQALSLSLRNVIEAPVWASSVQTGASSFILQYTVHARPGTTPLAQTARSLHTSRKLQSRQARREGIGVKYETSFGRL